MGSRWDQPANYRSLAWQKGAKMATKLHFCHVVARDKTVIRLARFRHGPADRLQSQIVSVAHRVVFLGTFFRAWAELKAALCAGARTGLADDRNVILSPRHVQGCDPTIEAFKGRPQRLSFRPSASLIDGSQKMQNIQAAAVCMFVSPTVVGEAVSPTMPRRIPFGAASC